MIGRSKKGESLINEKVKNTLFLKGKSTSQIVNDALKDLQLLAKPYCKALNRKNEILPFEDANSLEFLSLKNDCSLFLLGSHTKKRPHNLVMGRMYDGHLLDMFEFGIDRLQNMLSFNGGKKGIASKPVLIFQGDQWENDSLYNNVQNLLLDFFRGYKATSISMAGVDHAICCSIVDSKIFIRSYTLSYTKSDSKVPLVSLQDMGPHFDLSLRRHHTASQDLWKTATKKDKSNLTKKVKNIAKSSFGDKIGKIHMKKQNLDKMGVRRVGALRNAGKKRSLEVADNNSVKRNKR